MKIQTVSSDDDFIALKFYNEMQSERKAGVVLQRHAPFTAKYSCISRDFELYRLQNEQEDVLGLAAMAFVDGRFDGDFVPCAIGSDLKILRNRQTVMTWPQHFVEQLQKLRDEKGIRYVFSALGDGEREAYNTFIRPRSLRRNLPRYYLYRRFQIVNIHGFLPFSEKPLESIHISNADSRSFEQLTDYIYKKSLKRPLSIYRSPIDVADQIMRWPKYPKDRFLIARNHKGQIVGCVGLWRPMSLFKFKIGGPTDQAVFLHRLLKFGQLLGWSHSLSLKFTIHPVFLTHLHFDHPDVFSSLLRVAWRQTQKTEFLSYMHFKGDLATRPPRMVIKSLLDYALYLIQLSDDPIPTIWPSSANDDPPLFEIPYI